MTDPNAQVIIAWGIFWLLFFIGCGIWAFMSKPK